MIWGAVYVASLLALFVRVQDPRAAARIVPAPAPDEPLGLVRAHHALFYLLLLVAAPLEALALGGAEAHRGVGAIALASGVALYRWSAQALGDALSPLVRPHPAGRLVTEGPYRRLRHPMYLGQALVALGGPLVLGCRWALALSFAAAIVLFVRSRLEEDALAGAYAEYAAYRARAKRFLPFVF